MANVQRTMLPRVLGLFAGGTAAAIGWLAFDLVEEGLAAI
jgi:hypothetical protein